MTDKSTENLIVVKNSKIHGKGLFANKNIKEGQVLGHIEGKRTKRDGPYVLWVSEPDHGVRVECDLKYINHNNKPNAAYYDDLTVVAIKDIKKGEEITHHYGDDWG